MKAAARNERSGARLAGGFVVGAVVLYELAKLKPNEWNPNRMTQFERRALAHGFRTKGWITSQALLVWGTDEKGRRRDVIIDGEQRWTVATELGFERGPVVFLSRLTERDARALTFELDTKHGKFDPTAAAQLVQSLGVEDFPTVSLELGITEDALTKMMAFDVARPSSPPAPLVSQNQHTKTVPLYFTAERHERFLEAVRRLGAERSAESVTDIVERAVLDAAAAIK